MPDTVCIGASRIYRVNDASVLSRYTWKIDGVIQTSNKNDIAITWNVAGTFLITVQEHANGGCDGDVKSGLIYVIPSPVANAGPDSTICFGSTLQLGGSGSSGIYQWTPSTYLSNTTIANPVATIPLAGIYKYVLSAGNNFGCISKASDTVIITMLPAAKVFVGNDTSIAVNQLLQFNAVDINNSGFIKYQWTPSFNLSNQFIKNPIASPDKNTTYFLSATDAHGCVAQDDINVKVFQHADLYVPTGFTPNGDGLNDFAVVLPAGIKELKYFNIYSRWGELVFSTKNAAIGWSGIYKGTLQPSSVFVWTAEAIDFNGNLIRKKGTVTLIR